MVAETQITNFLYRYAACIDIGDLTGAAALFEHARIRIGADSDHAGLTRALPSPGIATWSTVNYTMTCRPDPEAEAMLVLTPTQEETR